jgi:hypothetical protein
MAGFAFWWALSEPYTRFLGAVAEPVLRIAERPAVTRLHPAGSKLTIDRSDFRKGSARPALAVPVLTVNFILLMALFASNARSHETGNVQRFLTAALALMPVHVLAILLNIQSIYATKLGAWSQRHYGTLARNFWTAAAHAYVMVGASGVAFLLWWLLKPAHHSRPRR